MIKWKQLVSVLTFSGLGYFLGMVVSKADSLLIDIGVTLFVGVVALALRHFYIKKHGALPKVSSNPISLFLRQFFASEGVSYKDPGTNESIFIAPSRRGTRFLIFLALLLCIKVTIGHLDFSSEVLYWVTVAHLVSDVLIQMKSVRVLRDTFSNCYLELSLRQRYSTEAVINLSLIVVFIMNLLAPDN
jgi:hypothetical protein